MILSGIARIGNDPVVRFTSTNLPVLDLSLAFSYGKKVDGKRQTQWIKSALFGDRAEKVAQYMTKGSQLFVILNEPHIEIYTKDGKEMYQMVAQLDKFEFISKTEKQEPKKEHFNDLKDNLPF